MSYVELHACSAFSFLRGASSPEQLAETAARLEMPAMALLDRNGVYGAQRFSAAAREKNVRPIVGAELSMENGCILPVLVQNRTGYKNLCELLTQAHLRSEKGECAVQWNELPQFTQGLVVLFGSGSALPARPCAGASPNGIHCTEAFPARAPVSVYREVVDVTPMSIGALGSPLPFSKGEEGGEGLLAAPPEWSAPDLRSPLAPHLNPLPASGERRIKAAVLNYGKHVRAPETAREGACTPQTPMDRVQRLIDLFGRDNVFVEIQRHFLRDEDRINKKLSDLASKFRLPLVATNGVQYARPNGRQVLDVFTCIREHTHLDAAGKLLSRNAERHLKSDAEMRALFPDRLDAIENTERLAERLEFSLENIGYEFPAFPVPAGHNMDSFLRTITLFGAQQRYSAISTAVKQKLEEELSLIQKLGFSGYFLIVWDIINFCREHNIMVQGRGSAANSAVCYCLGITPVDPVSNHLVFERFLSEGRKGWPDIDLDLPSGDRRESVIQEVYRRYGKHGAAMTANVITYRGRSAAREIGKALNLSANILDRFSHLFAHGDFPHTLDLAAQIEQAGLPKGHPRMPAFISLYQAIYGLPRHLGQHSGGMIICQGKLSSFVPLENASMPGRVVAQWDKDDCEDLGIVKVDLLGLGMMSVMQDAFALCRERGRPLDLAHIPTDDAPTYEMMQKADTIGVFQIESRAQMATLPRLRPKCFYDVVIEVAIIRPGPIQGDMVHPYLARRAGREEVTYFDPRLEPILGRTLGVPLFQEQMLKIAMIMADFSGSEAEELRRALSFHRSQERMEKVSVKLRAGLIRNNVAPEVIEKIIQSIGAFALYGFPESHAISFAILAYGSAYLKVHRAPEFYASLLNNQPMGFYTPATIVKDASRHGIRIRPVCVRESEWRCTVVSDDTARLGFCVVNGLRKEHGERLVEERRVAPFQSLDDLRRRVGLTKEELRTLAELGALNCFAEHRRAAMWQVEETPPEPLFTAVAENNCLASKGVSSRAAQTARDLPDANCGTQTKLERQSDVNARAKALAFERMWGPSPSARLGMTRVIVSPTQNAEDAKYVSSGESTGVQGQLGQKSDAVFPDNAPQAIPHLPPLPLRKGEATPNGISDFGYNTPLRPMTMPERVKADYDMMNLTTGPHPMKLLRPHLPNIWCAIDLASARHGDTIQIAGNVICRQRPGTAKGFVFISLEDETGVSNAIVTPDLFEQTRLLITEEPFLIIEGTVQNSDNVVLIKAREIRPLVHAQLVGTDSHDFH